MRPSESFLSDEGTSRLVPCDDRLRPRREPISMTTSLKIVRNDAVVDTTKWQATNHVLASAGLHRDRQRAVDVDDQRRCVLSQHVVQLDNARPVRG